MLTTELDIQKSLTHAFILTQPVTITLIPRSKVKKPAGGFVWQYETARDSQVMRLVEPSTPREAMPMPQSTSDGVQREIVFMLLGEWDSVIGLYDVFDHDGHRWEIVQLGHSNGWEQRASVARYA